MRRWATLAATAAGIAAVALLQDRALALQRLQYRLDAVALRGSAAVLDGEPVDREVRRALADQGLPSGPEALVEWPLRTGAFAGRREAVGITVTVRPRSRLLPEGWAGTHRIHSAAAAVPPHLSGGGRAFIRLE